ncbi:hypothetical protein ACH5RR_009604 [Cinchona calisaya]|uniref:Uncharacterized protein n=1 Tax=Cinchona calisaya TaxID=153742 RepID=A0ABD3AF33_9GENT
MAEAEAAYSQKGFFKSDWEGYKEFWCKRFSFLKTAREAIKYGAMDSVVGAVTAADWAWKYSRSLHVSDTLILFRRNK